MTAGRAAPLHLVLICLVVVWVSSKVAILFSSAVSLLTGVWLSSVCTARFLSYTHIIHIDKHTHSQTHLYTHITKTLKKILYHYCSVPTTLQWKKSGFLFVFLELHCHHFLFFFYHCPINLYYDLLD